jgi:RND family efflux transporter MFP subunit
LTQGLIARLSPQAEAQAARAEATLRNARQVTTRSRALATAQAVSKEELEANIAAERTAAADLAAARASVRNASLNLSFSTVRAPFSGRVSDRKVSLGDLVTDGETVLTRVVSLDPIWFAFEGAESFYLKNLRQDVRGERTSSPLRRQSSRHPASRRDGLSLAWTHGVPG